MAYLNFQTEIERLNQKQQSLKRLQAHQNRINKAEINSMVESSGVFKSKARVKREMFITGLVLSTVIITIISLI